MKYPNRKRARDERIFAHKEKHPDASLREIGRRFRISGERVRFILKRRNNGHSI